MRNIRPAQVAGYFYPADPAKLSKEINLMLDISEKQDKAENTKNRRWRPPRF